MIKKERTCFAGHRQSSTLNRDGFEKLH